MRALEVEHRVAASDRGEVAYQAVGQGPPVLFLGGLGASWRAFHQQIVHLSGRYRCLAWDYRGIYRDRQMPGRVVPGIDEHARDALAILDAEGAERAALVGWSLGVQVALSLFDRAPHRVSMMVLISGGARAPWGETPGAGPIRRLYPGLFSVLGRAPGAVATLLRAGASSPETLAWARRLGLLSGDIDQDLFAEVARNLGRLDVEAVLKTLDAMARRDYSPVLSRVDVPVLVIGGDRDPFTSRASLEQVVHGVAGAEYLLLPGASHYALLDRAEHVNLRIEKFFGERGYTAEAA
ncbi:MAG: alpha/beta hydrolase [Myxococcales bacterium]|jgi:pimeloyl-ACP methyl ester carboxylesterase